MLLGAKYKRLGQQVVEERVDGKRHESVDSFCRHGPRTLGPGHGGSSMDCCELGRDVAPQQGRHDVAHGERESGLTGEESNIQHGLYGSRGGAAIADCGSDWERRVPTVVQAMASVRQRKEADEVSCSWPSRHVVIAKTGTDTTRCACRQYQSPQNVRVLHEADAFAQARLPTCPHQNYHMHYCHEHCVCSVMSLTAGRGFPVGYFGEDIEVR